MIFIHLCIFSLLDPLYQLTPRMYVMSPSPAWPGHDLAGGGAIPPAIRIQGRRPDQTMVRECQPGSPFGSQLIPFFVLAAILFILILYGFNAATESTISTRSANIVVRGAPCGYRYLHTSPTRSDYSSINSCPWEVAYSNLVASVTVFAVGFIVRGDRRRPHIL